jgi:hypothetical protein
MLTFRILVFRRAKGNARWNNRTIELSLIRFSRTWSLPTQSQEEEAVQGRGRYARIRRRAGIPTTSHPLATFSGGGSWAKPF